MLDRTLLGNTDLASSFVVGQVRLHQHSLSKIRCELLQRPALGLGVEEVDHDDRHDRQAHKDQVVPPTNVRNRRCTWGDVGLWTRSDASESND